MFRICPECNKAFYASSDVESLSCPHCGYVLLDRRGMKRIRRKSPHHLKTVSRKK